MKIEQINIDEIKLNQKNARNHSEKQIKQIAKSIEKFGFNVPCLIDKKMMLVSGHGRFEASKLLKLKEIPCIKIEHLTEKEIQAFAIADNQLALNSSWNLENLSENLFSLKDVFALDVLGFKQSEINKYLLNVDEIVSDTENKENRYTNKIEIPIYEPKRESPPSFKEMYNVDKYEKLMSEIKNENLSKQEKLFLEFSATRFIEFNYSEIAEYYCHASEAVKNLMEKLALVVIDYDKAIENGFVKLTKEMQNIQFNSEEDVSVEND